MRRHWQIRLTQLAEHDFFDILQWTAKHFGKRQAGVYATTLRCSLKALVAEPELLGSRSRRDIGPDILTLHVARKGRNGRHFIVFRIHEDARIVEVIVLPFTENIGHRASIYVEEYSLSSGIGTGDAIIAATAVENNMLLASSNVKHFRVIKDLQFKAFKP